MALVAAVMQSKRQKKNPAHHAAAEGTPGVETELPARLHHHRHHHDRNHAMASPRQRTCKHNHLHHDPTSQRQHVPASRADRCQCGGLRWKRRGRKLKYNGTADFISASRCYGHRSCTNGSVAALGIDFFLSRRTCRAAWERRRCWILVERSVRVCVCLCAFRAKIDSRRPSHCRDGIVGLSLLLLSFLSFFLSFFFFFRRNLGPVSAGGSFCPPPPPTEVSEVVVY